MKTIIKLTAKILIAVFLLASCNNTNLSKQDEDTFKRSLTEKQIGKSNFYISLPDKYSIKESEGPDFMVYYILPTDTTDTSSLSCGIYFGNAPSEFKAKNETCKQEVMNGQILGNSEEWKVFDCDGEYSIQTIIDSKSREGWNDRIHAFGRATSKADLNKILIMYSTLHKKK